MAKIEETVFNMIIMELEAVINHHTECEGPTIEEFEEVTKVLDLIKDNNAIFFDLRIIKEASDGGDPLVYNFDRFAALVDKYRTSRIMTLSSIVGICVPNDLAPALDIRRNNELNRQVISDPGATHWMHIYLELDKRVTKHCNEPSTEKHAYAKPILDAVHDLSMARASTVAEYFHICSERLRTLYIRIIAAGMDVRDATYTCIGEIFETIYTNMYFVAAETVAQRRIPDMVILKQNLAQIRVLVNDANGFGMDDQIRYELGARWHFVYKEEKKLLQDLGIPDEDVLSQVYVNLAHRNLGNPMYEVCGISINEEMQKKWKEMDDQFMDHLRKLIENVRDDDITRNEALRRISEEASRYLSDVEIRPARITEEDRMETNTILVPENKRLDALVYIEKARKEGMGALHASHNIEFAKRYFRILVDRLDLREALDTLYGNDPVELKEAKRRMVEIPVSLLKVK